MLENTITKLPLRAAQKISKLLATATVCIAASNAANAAEDDGARETYCAHNDSAGYAGVLVIEYRMPENYGSRELWHTHHSHFIGSPSRACVHAPRAAGEIVVSLKLAEWNPFGIGSSGGAGEFSGLSYNRLSDIEHCHLYQSRQSNGSNRSGKHGIHGVDFRFFGTALDPRCESRLH